MINLLPQFSKRLKIFAKKDFKNGKKNQYKEEVRILMETLHMQNLNKKLSR